MMSITAGNKVVEIKNSVSYAQGKEGHKKKLIAPVGILKEYMWKALFSFHPLVVQAILFIVVPILGPISPPMCIFGVTT
ncbi:hypothetical protein E2C01_015800 [Portunus trituberculatus]|uniref:Uncharacterized protein n=1 Tax=Portunus trituberculatus TaxID=210409 RepID=A0A5B7DP08_PORTR|nr:hypothetical protein [Portunus trituberculatus]